ncbi:MAG: YicC family protein [Victivallales bacterium]|nr:YicC family protein [Victivallales bacterium]
MKSMTGYGRGVAEGDGASLAVEISAVNSRKQVDMRFSIPRELGMLEPLLRQRIQQRLSRGSLYVAVNYQLAPEQVASAGRIKQVVAQAVANELREVAKAAGLNPPTIAEVLAVPGVLNQERDALYEPLRELVEPALAQALTALSEARVAEGRRLCEDLEARGRQMQQLLANIEIREPEALQQFKERLKTRLQELGGDQITMDEERLARELVFYADKADITEEVVRLKSHFVKYFQLLSSDGDPGRELDFLGQEMNREITTLSSKTTDLCIAEDALALKIEISKVREQIMNIE